MRRSTDKLSKHKLEDVGTDNSARKISFTATDWRRCGEGFDDATQEKKETRLQKKCAVSSSRDFDIGSSFGYLTYQHESLKETQNSAVDILWDSSDSGDESKNVANADSATHKLPKPELHASRVNTKPELHTPRASRVKTKPELQQPRASRVKTKPELHTSRASRVNTKHVKHEKVRKHSQSSWGKEEDEDITVTSSDAELDDPDVQRRTDGTSPDLIEINESEESSARSSKQEEDFNTGKLSSISPHSPVILSCQSSQSTNSISPSTGLKGSDWIKNVQWQLTPVKKDVTSDSVADVDSAKKNKEKFKKGGFAEQLSRVRSREKSSVRMWSYEKDEGAAQTQSSRVLCVRVQSFELVFSLQLTHCLIADGDDEEKPVTAEEWQTALVLFSKQLMDQLQIQVGSVLRIHAPWQQLEGVHRKHSILLCTHYIQLVTQLTTPLNVDSSTPAKLIYMQWNCPCSLDCYTDPKHCPAHEFPVVPSTLKQVKDKTECIDGPTAFHTITANEKPSPVVFRSLLESIEKAGTHSLKPLCFKAVVHRIFYKQEKQKFSLLVEDHHGTIAVIAVPSNYGNEALWEMEGKSVSFSGLLVDSRTNRDKDPSLFSLIDVVWSGVNASASQDSDPSEMTSTLQHSTYHQPPGFCYNLKSDNESFCMEPGVSVSSCYSQSALSSLNSVSQCHLMTRKSFLAKVIFRYEEEKSPSSSSHPPLPDRGRQLYITDSSLQEEGCTYVTIWMNFNKCQDDVIINKSAVFFKDVLVVDGKCQIDVYSEVSQVGSGRHSENNFSTETLQALRNLYIQLPEISNSCTEHSLVSVSGCICDVDDEASYSWEVCDLCHGAELTTRSNKQGLFCKTCQRIVSSPETMLKMEVYVQTEQLTSDCRLKITLLQSTAKSLLPKCQDVEGYDINCVLLKTIGPLLCFISNVTKRDLLEIVAQEIQT